MLRSITVGRAGPDVTGDRCPPNLDHPHETAATISGSIKGAGMVSRTSPTSSGSRELRLPVETGIRMSAIFSKGPVQRLSTITSFWVSFP